MDSASSSTPPGGSQCPLSRRRTRSARPAPSTTTPATLTECLKPSVTAPPPCSVCLARQDRASARGYLVDPSTPAGYWTGPVPDGQDRHFGGKAAGSEC